MTQKEILYMEELLGMEQQCYKMCQSMASTMQNKECKDICMNLSNMHKAHLNTLNNTVNNK
jgi:glutamate formiminotransferase